MEYGLTRAETKKVLKQYDDLRIQAMIFDMDLDVETWSLVKKEPIHKRTWLDDYKDKLNDSDDHYAYEGEREIR